MMMEKTTNQLSAIEQIKEEFMERWGVNVSISLQVHWTKNEMNEEKAKEIVSAFTDTPRIWSHEGVSGVSYDSLSERERPPFELSVYYRPEKAKGWEVTEVD